MKSLCAYLRFAALFLIPLCGSAQEKPDTLSRYIYESVEQMPEFPGGVIEMEKYVLQHLRLPAMKEPPSRIGVYTRFIVHANGSVSDVKIARSSGNTALDDSVKAVIYRMPVWKPGMLNGRPVNCYYNLPISGFKFK